MAHIKFPMRETVVGGSGDGGGGKTLEEQSPPDCDARYLSLEYDFPLAAGDHHRHTI